MEYCHLILVLYLTPIFLWFAATTPIQSATASLATASLPIHLKLKWPSGRKQLLALKIVYLMIITFRRRLLNFMRGIGMICIWKICMTTVWFILPFISSTLRSRIPSSKTIHRESSIGSVRTHFYCIDNQCKY